MPLKHPGKLNTLIQMLLMLPFTITHAFYFISLAFFSSMSTHHILECGVCQNFRMWCHVKIHILLLGSAVDYQHIF